MTSTSAAIAYQLSPATTEYVVASDPLHEKPAASADDGPTATVIVAVRSDATPSRAVRTVERRVRRDACMLVGSFPARCRGTVATTGLDVRSPPARGSRACDTGRMNVVPGDDGQPRCGWGVSTPDYQAYHDDEWGVGVSNDTRLFEKICLEGFQSGLSWLTILRKRDNFRSAFAGFDMEQVASFGDTDVERLLGDAGIVRHQGKIRSTINNAGRAIELIEQHGSLAHFFWPHATFSDTAVTEVPALTDTSTMLSKQLKKMGWSFVGPTTMYAFMQAMGLVNDHVGGCVVRDAAEASRRAVAASVGVDVSPS